MPKEADKRSCDHLRHFEQGTDTSLSFGHVPSISTGNFAANPLFVWVV